MDEPDARCENVDLVRGIIGEFRVGPDPREPRVLDRGKHRFEVVPADDNLPLT
jgi:hypothetical protein